MARRLTVTGRVVEADGAKVVRFAPRPGGCPAAAGGSCACGRRAPPDVALAYFDDTAAVNAEVELSVASRGLTIAAAALFGLPLGLLLLGGFGGSILAGRLAWPADLGAAAGGLSALGLGWWLAARSSGALLRMLRLNVRIR